MKSDKIITIDGPAGSGKSTLALNLAQAFGWVCLDTGALYRAVALVALERGLTPSDRQEAAELARTLDLRLYVEEGKTLVVAGDREVSSLIRTPEISNFASLFSALPEVREALVDAQRNLGSRGEVVAEGRDMGTVIFPWAALKFFLTAEAKVRAYRRHLQLAREGIVAELEKLEEDILIRDHNDSSRETAQLKPAPDAFIIDGTNLSAFEVETIMIGEAKRVFGL
ncbi:MAG: (d)CMP kinase [Deltaproteobacteria bacterium]|jgi:cytidylate kinase|nr:(d)CMP kinase [Deltaproteobacteria bacterium]